MVSHIPSWLQGADADADADANANAFSNFKQLLTEDLSNIRIQRWCNVQCQGFSAEEATWEDVDHFQKKYHTFFL